MRIVSILAGIAMLASTLAAQTLHSVSATVPFSFIVANQTIAPGNYLVNDFGANNTIRLWTKNSKVNIGLIALGATDRRAKPAGYVFNKYGDRYFLAQVRRDDGTGWFVPKCKMERELVTSRITAQSGVRVEQVVVLARVR